MNDNLPWLILLLPLLAAVLIALFGRKSRAPAPRVSVAAVVAAFFCAVTLWVGTLGDLVGGNAADLASRHFNFIWKQPAWTWLDVGAAAR